MCAQAAQLAALQERLEEVVALHQHASDEAETLRVGPSLFCFYYGTLVPIYVWSQTE